MLEYILVVVVVVVLAADAIAVVVVVVVDNDDGCRWLGRSAVISWEVIGTVLLGLVLEFAL